MRTIFITCIRGIIARNILATGAFRILRDRQDFRIILLAPTTRVAILQKEFGAPNVEVALISPGLISEKVSSESQLLER